VLVAVSIKDQAKFAFGRLWPETWVYGNPSWIANGAYGFAPFHGGAGWSSFPSGHMTVITAPMVVLALAQPRWRWIAAIPVALVAIGLFGADYHFVGDMIAGTLLGWVCAAIAVGVVDRRLAATERRPAANAGPVVGAPIVRVDHMD
jgi:membrane-associated phospholipid phosphatase